MQTLKDKIYYFLREKIDNLELEPGTPLIETEISEQMGVSRTPVREAIRRLVKEGLASTVSPRTTVVASINPEDVEKIYEVRAALEILALEISINRIENHEIEEIEHAYCESNENLKEAYALDLKTHDLWINHSNNNRLMIILENLDKQVARYRHYSHQVPRREALSIEEHRKILHAIRSRNLQMARTYLLIHLENTKNNIIHAMNKNK